MEKTAAEAAVELSGAISGHSDEVGKLTAAFTKANRRTRWIIASVIFNIVLTFGVAYNANTGHASCEASNDARHGQITLWNKKIIPIIVASNPGTDPKDVQAFELYINNLFKPRDCKIIL